MPVLNKEDRAFWIEEHFAKRVTGDETKVILEVMNRSCPTPVHRLLADNSTRVSP